MHATNESPVYLEIAPDYDAQIVTHESQALTQSERIRAIVVTDQGTYEQAVEHGRLIATFIAEVEVWFEPFISALRGPLDQFYSAKKGVLDIAKADKAYLAGQVGSFEREQERIRRENERIAREEHDRQERDARINAAVQAEEAGLKPESVERILSEPLRTIAPMAPPTFQKAPGTSGRQYWKAFPLNDDPDAAKRLLVRAAAQDGALLAYLTVNESACNKKADIEKTAMKLPGFEARAEAKSSFRKV